MNVIHTPTSWHRGRWFLWSLCSLFKMFFIPLSPFLPPLFIRNPTCHLKQSMALIHKHESFQINCLFISIRFIHTPQRSISKKNRDPLSRKVTQDIQNCFIHRELVCKHDSTKLVHIHLSTPQSLSTHIQEFFFMISHPVNNSSLHCLSIHLETMTNKPKGDFFFSACMNLENKKHSKDVDLDLQITVMAHMSQFLAMKIYTSIHISSKISHQHIYTFTKQCKIHYTKRQN